MSAGVKRIDQALVSRGLARSRAQAKEALTAGQVMLDGAVVTKGSTKVSPEDVLEVAGEIDHYVGRAAHKLLAALEAFPEVAEAVPGTSAIDVGASTGGFTQVLLERGVEHVVALDVGHWQLAEPVRSDTRVTDLEGFNIRDVIGPGQLDGQPFDLVVSDLSFISLRLALPHMVFLLAPDGHLIVLVKPQFEVGRERLGRTGVVTSREQRRESVERVLAVAHEQGLRAHGLAWSPVVGSHGNYEYVMWLRRESVGGSLNAEAFDARLDDLTRRDDT